jgi:predicted nucleic acid-binding protein
MSDSVFFDTNVLVYSCDIDSGGKRLIAESLLLQARQDDNGVVSMQVLQEFYNTVTRKLGSPMPREKARIIVHSLSQWCTETTPAEIFRAFQIEDQTKISFWDAMIVSAAIKAGATRILSEDLNAGQVIGGVLIENPFAGA